PPWCFLIFPSFAIGLGAILSGIPIVKRLLRRQSVSPGETLWLIVGVDQLVYWLCFLSTYRIDLLPSQSSFYGQIKPLFFLPLLAGTAAGMVPLLWFHSSPRWRRLFVANIVLWGIALMDAATPRSDQPVEESLLTAVPPFFLAAIAVAAMAVTWFDPPAPEWAKRRRAHWTLLGLCLVPAVWFSGWMVLGFVQVRPLFLRILD
ncbi:MAG: hypothetical protein ACRELG_06840, partial [Gemmataceae bacterium]